MSELIITIDGPAGSGKSTVARRVAAELGWAFLDSGAMYRALCIAVIESNIDPVDGTAVERIAAKTVVRLEIEKDRTLVFLNAQDVTLRIRTEEVSKIASAISAYSGVRGHVVAWQREFAAGGPTVAEGRDMGSAVFPDAAHKFYLDATRAERARRRHAELAARGEDADFGEIFDEINHRDARDREREASPLVVPEGAVIIDTEGKSIDEVTGEVMSHIGEYSGGNGGGR